jgi:hypothetical protein
MVDEVNVSWFPNEVVIANLLNYSRSQPCWKVRQDYIGFGTMDRFRTTKYSLRYATLKQMTRKYSA